MTVRKISNYSDFISMKDEWNELHAQSSSPVFSSWEFAYAWMKHFASEAEPYIILSENGSINGIAPLVKMDGRLQFIGTGIPSHPLSPVRDGVYDYSDIIIAQGYETVALDFLQALKDGDYPAYLQDIPANSPLVMYSQNSIPGDTCPVIDLPVSWESYLTSLGKSMRDNLKYYMKKTEKSGAEYVRIDRISEGDMEIFFDLNRRRTIQMKDGYDQFADDGMRAFHAELSRALSDREHAELHVLCMGKPVSVVYSFRHKGRIYFYLSGMDPDYSSYSPTTALLGHIIRNAISDGDKEFDFLRGDEPYKFRYGAVPRRNYNIEIG